MVKSRTLASLLIFLVAVTPAFAQNTKAARKDPVTARIPEQPSQPPQLTVKQPNDPFRCERDFVYQGERIKVDSTVRQDGERLRPIIKDVPQAVAELDTYQANRRNIRNTAYIGSVGLVLLVVGPLFTGHTRQLTQDLVSYGGLGLLVGSALYGISTLQTNEAHLGNAVHYYNARNPDRPIELLFTTELNL